MIHCNDRTHTNIQPQAHVYIYRSDLAWRADPVACIRQSHFSTIILIAQVAQAMIPLSVSQWNLSLRPWASAPGRQSRHNYHRQSIVSGTALKHRLFFPLQTVLVTLHSETSYQTKHYNNDNIIGMEQSAMRPRFIYLLSEALKVWMYRKDNCRWQDCNNPWSIFFSFPCYVVETINWSAADTCSKRRL